MSSVISDLVGEYVWIHDEGDAGTVRAVFTDRDGELFVLINRDNVSQDFRVYSAESISTKREVS